MSDTGFKFKATMASPLLLGTAMIIIPLLLGIGYVLLHNTITGRQIRENTEAVPELPHDYLKQLSTAPLQELTNLYHLARINGVGTTPINLAIWAAMADNPACVMSINPPDDNSAWEWRCSIDGRYALALARNGDTAGRRNVALCDLITNEWIWHSLLPWPESYDDPYIVGLCTIVHFEKNERRMALEVDPHGKIIALDYLPGKPSDIPPPILPPPPRGVSGRSIALRNGLLMVADNANSLLHGYALNALPGLYPLEPSTAATTTFSGNGRLRFDIAAGQVSVHDTLTHTLMQEVEAWRHTTNTTITSTLAARDGANLSIFFSTHFGEERSRVTRDWSASLSTYSGKVRTSYDATVASRPTTTENKLELTSPNKRWHFKLSPTGTLEISNQTQTTPTLAVNLAPITGPDTFTELTMLEEGRHLILRQAAKLWLLDFECALGYADLQARYHATRDKKDEPVVAIDSDDLGDPTIDPYYEYSDAQWIETLSSLDIPSPAPVALQAELMLAHQLWSYAAWLLDAGASYSAMDIRAPRINPLLRARTHIKAAHAMQQRSAAENEPALLPIASASRKSARDISKSSLISMLNSYYQHSRMERYQLQGFLFAQE